MHMINLESCDSTIAHDKLASRPFRKLTLVKLSGEEKEEKKKERKKERSELTLTTTTSCLSSHEMFIITIQIQIVVK